MVDSDGFLLDCENKQREKKIEINNNLNFILNII